MIKFETPDVATILKGADKAMKRYSKKLEKKSRQNN